MPEGVGVAVGVGVGVEVSVDEPPPPQAVKTKLTTITHMTNGVLYVGDWVGLMDGIYVGDWVGLMDGMLLKGDFYYYFDSYFGNKYAG